MLRQFLTQILDIVLEQASPFLREQLVGFVQSIEEAALATDNPWDDDLVAALKEVLGIEDA